MLVSLNDQDGTSKIRCKSRPGAGKNKEKCSFFEADPEKVQIDVFSQIFYHCLPRRYGMAEVLLRMQAFVRGAAGRAGAVSA